MTLQELLDWIARYDTWVYAVLWTYCFGKTGPLPMLAGYAAALGALSLEAVLTVMLLGSMAGGQARFVVGRFASPWVCRTFNGAAPWVALASAGVEHYSLRVLLGYRFVKGAFSLVGFGAGASLIPWRRHVLLDGLGALIWIGSMVTIGWSFGLLGADLDPRWAAYVGLTLLVASSIAFALFGRRIKLRLQPLAERILEERRVHKAGSGVAA